MEVTPDLIPTGLTAQEWSAITSHLKPNSGSINDYRKILNLLHSYDNGIYRIYDMNKEDAINYFNYLEQRVNEGTLSSTTLHRYQATIRSIAQHMENHPEIWPNYKNPFKGLLKNETRVRTKFTPDILPDLHNVQLFTDYVKGRKNPECIISQMIVGMGLLPVLISEIKMSDFTLNQETQCLSLKIGTGFIVEKTHENPDNSPFYRTGYPVKLIKQSKSGTLTWEYIGTFNFSKEFSDMLRAYFHLTGISDADRLYFRTNRSTIFSYRIIHHQTVAICKKLGINHSLLTPKQLAYFGLVRNWLIWQGKAEGEMPMGDWDNFYPLPLAQQAELMCEQLGIDYVIQATGLKKKTEVLPQ